ncbi:MAG TPA: TlpA disulfide reductase family protein, partial [Chitinophagaceae bacterium]
MKSILVAAILTMVGGYAFAQKSGVSQALMVGDDMPPFAVQKWIKGGPVDITVKGKVYLIDFWAAWCGPCLAGMPHLSELSKKYLDEGLVVIGATSEDQWGNSYEQVKKFLDERREAYDYNFAWLDDSYRKDHKYRSIIYNPMLAAVYDTSGFAFPQVFLVDKHGKIAFIGDGAALQESYIKMVLEDRHDLAKERDKYARQRTADRELEKLSKLFAGKDYAGAYQLGRTILTEPNVSSHAA